MKPSSTNKKPTKKADIEVLQANFDELKADYLRLAYNEQLMTKNLRNIEIALGLLVAALPSSVRELAVKKAGSDPDLFKKALSNVHSLRTSVERSHLTTQLIILSCIGVDDNTEPVSSTLH